jgi:hypothetical protein
MLRRLSPILLVAVLLSGCSSSFLTPTVPVELHAPGVTGHVRGGQQPLSGAALQLYAVGTSGSESAATPLLTQAVTSDSAGAFTLTGMYHCNPSDFIYLTATGGNPGVGSVNPNSVLMAALGPCSSLTPSLTIVLNEVTTVAAVYALAPWMASPSSVGSDPAGEAALASAFTLAAQFANISTGATPGSGIPTGFSVPVAQINTVANILAACVNSPGGSSGDGSFCGTFFALTDSLAADTVTALLHLAQNPTLNTASLFALPPPSSPFQPVDSVQPADLSIALIPPAGSSILPGANVNLPFTEGSGAVAHDISANHNDCTFATAANAPAWVAAGIDHLSPGYNNSTPRYCAFPPSVTLTDLSETNSRTKTWCGYLRPILPGMSNVIYSILLGASNENGIAALWMNGNNTPLAAYYAGSYAGYDVPTFTSDSIVGWHCVTITLGSNTDSTSDHFFYDGTEVSGYTRQGVSWDHRAVGDYDTLGYAPWSPGAFFEGVTSYLLEYPFVLTPAQIAANVEALQSSAFAARGVGAIPPQSTSTANQILCNGDSITNETPAAVSYCNELTGLNQSFNVTNIGHAGSIQLTMVSNIPLEEGVLFAPNAPYSFASMAGGINDININGASAATVFNYRVLWAQKVASIGWKPIWLTMPSSKQGGDPTVQAVNASLRAAAAGLGVTLVDIATDPCIGATGAYANPPGCNDFTDGIHPNQTGEDSIRNSYVNVVNYLTGSTAASPTLVSAATYQLRSSDAYTSISPSGASTAITLPSCIGFSATTPFTISNVSSTAAVTVAPSAGQTLNGAISAVAIPNRASLSFRSEPLDPSVGGCTWIAQ